MERRFHYSRLAGAETRNPKLEASEFGIANEAGMSFRMNGISLTATASIPDLAKAEAGAWKIETGEGQL